MRRDGQSHNAGEGRADGRHSVQLAPRVRLPCSPLAARCSLASPAARLHAVQTMLAEWLADVPRSEFDAKYFRRSPFARPAAAARAGHFLTWRTIHELSDSSPLPGTLIVRDGHLLEDTPSSFRDYVELFQMGYSLVFRRCERHHPELRALASLFEQEIEGEVSIQLYVTPRGFRSFGWHYDVEDVFLVQTGGVKEYFLRENTVNPRPTLDSMPKDMHFERETTPTMATTLIAGDWLYIPRGWWHVARAVEDALSISVGVLGTDARGAATVDPTERVSIA